MSGIMVHYNVIELTFVSEDSDCMLGLADGSREVC